MLDKKSLALSEEDSTNSKQMDDNNGNASNPANCDKGTNDNHMDVTNDGDNDGANNYHTNGSNDDNNNSTNNDHLQGTSDDVYGSNNDHVEGTNNDEIGTNNNMDDTNNKDFCPTAGSEWVDMHGRWYCRTFFPVENRGSYSHLVMGCLKEGWDKKEDPINDPNFELAMQIISLKNNPLYVNHSWAEGLLCEFQNNRYAKDTNMQGCDLTFILQWDGEEGPCTCWL